MANTNTSATPKTKRGMATNKSTKSVSEDNIVKNETKPIIPKDIDSSQYVVVKNGFQGKLIYKSSRTGETFMWDSFGAEQEMELRELRNAKNSYKNFFINNWFMFDEDWIVDYLGVRQYYKNAISIDEFDSIFDKDADELNKVISNLSEGQKRSLAYRAKELISQNKIDSLSTISVLEKALNIELIEK